MRKASPVVLFAMAFAMLIGPVFPATSARAEAPALLNYQGKLVQGTNLYSGQLSLKFRLYASPESGYFFESTTSVYAVDGVYSAVIGDNITQIPYGWTFARVMAVSTSLWLQVVVNGTPMFPYEPICSVGYSLHSWNLTGNSGTDPIYNYLGTPDDSKLIFKVNNQTAMRFEPAGAATPNIVGGLWDNSSSGSGNMIAGGHGHTIGSGADNVVGGGEGNAIIFDSHSVIGGGMNNQILHQTSVIGGGNGNRCYIGQETVGGGAGNIASNYYATIGGGADNRASGERSTVAGGTENKAYADKGAIGGGRLNEIYGTATSAAIGGGEINQITSGSAWADIAGGYQNTIQNSSYSAIGGGWENKILNSEYAMIPGGSSNSVVLGDYSFAAGYHAKATTSGCFVWSDASSEDAFTNTYANQFSVRCDGGVKFVNHDATAGAYWNPGSIGWNFVSDRNQKENIEPIDFISILEKIDQMPISEWNYKGYPNRHIGPMAQDFYAAFPLVGSTNVTIDSGDMIGVSLAAIKGLRQIVRDQDAIIAAQQTELNQLKSRVSAIEQAIHAPTP
jgi:hypothetical protein